MIAKPKEQPDPMAGIASSPCCLRYNGGCVERFAISTLRRVTSLLRKVSCIAC